MTSASGWPKSNLTPAGVAAPVGYRAAHARVATVNGPAHRHACRHCQRTIAADWAYNHNAAHELVSPDGLLYSLNPHDYIPLCRRCHRRFDDLFRPRRRDARGRYIPTKDAMTATWPAEGVAS